MPRPARWKLDLANDNNRTLSAPPGFSDSSRDGDAGGVKKKQGDMRSLKESMAMEVATGQGRGLMMNMFMMWMAGNSLHIFPIMMVGMAIWSPVAALLNMKNAFVRFESNEASLIMPKL